MIISQVISNINETIRQVANGLANRLTAADNWGPEGEKFQVLTSRGPRDTDPPPQFMSIEDILKGISLDGDTNGTTIPGLPGTPGPQGIAGPQGPPGVDGASGMVPTYIGPTETFIVPVNKQALFNMAIVVDGILEVDGFLIEVP